MSATVSHGARDGQAVGKPKVTAAYVFLRTLHALGITHCFVNLGSDHPAILEAFAESAKHNVEGLTYITCPHEMVALTAAQGYAQQSGKPAAVIVHVDVGTQNLGGAIHNVDRCRVPVIIWAGASPFNFDDKLVGSRNEFINYLQDVHDQPAILRQYMRYVGQINAGSQASSVTKRAWQMAVSEPAGPVYVWNRREHFEETLEPSAAHIDVKGWTAVDKVGLSPKAVRTISEALLSARKPLLITSYAGRNPAAVSPLIALCERLALPVILASPVTVNVPFDHPNFVAICYGREDNPHLREADVILLVDVDVPWIPLLNKPNDSARIFHIDVDPLKRQMAYHDIPAELRVACDAEIALEQLLEATEGKQAAYLQERKDYLQQNSRVLLKKRIELEAAVPADKSITVPYLLSELRKVLPPRTFVASEGISNYPLVWEHLNVTQPGMMHTSGASSLGYALSGAIGAHLASRAGGNEHDLTVAVMGDGSFLFAVPTSAYWVARKYNAPFLTVILNNGGWKSPRYSALAVHPTGATSKAPIDDLHVGFGPHPVDYSAVAVAAGGAWGKILDKREDVAAVVAEAVRVVREEKRCAVLDVHLSKFYEAEVVA